MGEKKEVPVAVALEAEAIDKMSKCIRCGKERVVKSSYTEKLEKTSVVYTVTICPDPECQKMVEKGLMAEETKRKLMYDEHEKRSKINVKAKAPQA